MSKTVNIQSPGQLSQLTTSSTIVVIDFYADWCGPCKTIAPIYEQLSAQLSRPGRITFTKVNTDTQQQIARSYDISAMPTFIVLKKGRETDRVRGPDPKKLQSILQRLATEAESIDANGAASSSSFSPDGAWHGAAPPRGYNDITDQIDTRGLDLLNADSAFGSARTLFESSKPSGLDTKGKSKDAIGETKDWVESDTDEQLMLYIPFNATLKIHTLHITSLAEGTDDDAPMRPRRIKLYTNRAHNLGFEEADGMTATQEITLEAQDWDAETGTARVELRFVKFQKCSSLVVFIVDGDGTGERVRVDRVRVMGDSGEKREMGKLEKIGDQPGE